MTSKRYRLYREHKYVTFILSSFSASVAKSDFTIDTEVNSIKEKLAEIAALLHAHAHHENTKIHPLLKNKGSYLYEKIEAEHSAHHETFKKLNQILITIVKTTDFSQKIALGHQFYLETQRLEAKNLLHQIYEESIIMPELQRLYTDEELLMKIDAQTYEVMTSEQMIQMIETLFPHFNTDDRIFFLNDIYQCQPEKFQKAWVGIAPKLDSSELDQCLTRLGLS